jgi:hypothetical protein
MTAPRVPEAQHPRFDRLTANLDEYDAMPSLSSEPADHPPQHDEDGRSEQLDDQILAGLVLPY